MFQEFMYPPKNPRFEERKAMKKLIDAFRLNPTYDNARKVWQYDRSHPMAACILTKDDCDILAECVRIAIGAPK